MSLIRRSVLLVLACACLALGQEILPGHEPTATESEHTAWIDSVLRAAQTIKPGKTRADLLKVFTEEGGKSTRLHRQYVYRGCPYIKVDVDFAAVGAADATGESPQDKIVKISRPYLEWSIMD